MIIKPRMWDEKIASCANNGITMQNRNYSSADLLRFHHYENLPKNLIFLILARQLALTGTSYIHITTMIKFDARWFSLVPNCHMSSPKVSRMTGLMGSVLQKCLHDTARFCRKVSQFWSIFYNVYDVRESEKNQDFSLRSHANNPWPIQLVWWS